MRLEAPPSRYRVVERDGRLVVIDSQAGAAPAPPARASTVPSVTPKTMIAEPPGVLRSVAASVTGDVRDDDGRLLLDTASWYDTKAPRTIALSLAGERRLGGMVLAAVALVIVAIFLIMMGYTIGWVIAIGGFALANQGKPVTTAWIDRLAGA